MAQTEATSVKLKLFFYLLKASVSQASPSFHPPPPAPSNPSPRRPLLPTHHFIQFLELLPLREYESSIKHGKSVYVGSLLRNTFMICRCFKTIDGVLEA